MSACAHDVDPSSSAPVDKSEMVAIDLTETVHTESNGAGAKKQDVGAKHAVSSSLIFLSRGRDRE